MDSTHSLEIPESLLLRSSAPGTELRRLFAILQDHHKPVGDLRLLRYQGPWRNDKTSVEICKKNSERTRCSKHGLAGTAGMLRNSRHESDAQAWRKVLASDYRHSGVSEKLSFNRLLSRCSRDESRWQVVLWDGGNLQGTFGRLPGSDPFCLWLHPRQGLALVLLA